MIGNLQARRSRRKGLDDGDGGDGGNRLTYRQHATSVKLRRSLSLDQAERSENCSQAERGWHAQTEADELADRGEPTEPDPEQVARWKLKLEIIDFVRFRLAWPSSSSGCSRRKRSSLHSTRALSPSLSQHFSVA